LLGGWWIFKEERKEKKGKERKGKARERGRAYDRGTIGEEEKTEIRDKRV
jgi:hypothetical protein